MWKVNISHTWGMGWCIEAASLDSSNTSSDVSKLPSICNYRTTINWNEFNRTALLSRHCACFVFHLPYCSRHNKLSQVRALSPDVSVMQSIMEPQMYLNWKRKTWEDKGQISVITVLQYYHNNPVGILSCENVKDQNWTFKLYYVIIRGPS